MHPGRLIGQAVLHISHKARQNELTKRASWMKAQNLMRQVRNGEPKSGQILLAERAAQRLCIVEDSETLFDQIVVIRRVGLRETEPER